MEVRLHAEAVVDLAEAGDWYEQQLPGLGLDLLHEVDRAIAVIEKDPGMWPAWPGLGEVTGVRRFLLQRFPFAVAYLITDESVVILAIAHLRRRPGYWSRRRSG